MALNRMGIEYLRVYYMICECENDFRQRKFSAAEVLIEHSVQKQTLSQDALQQEKEDDDPKSSDV